MIFQSTLRSIQVADAIRRQVGDLDLQHIAPGFNAAEPHRERAGSRRVPAILH